MTEGISMHFPLKNDNNEGLKVTASSLFSGQTHPLDNLCQYILHDLYIHNSV